MSPVAFAALALAVLAAGWLVNAAAEALVPFVLSAVAAYVAAPAAAKLESRNLPPWAAAAVVTVLFLALIIAAPLAIAPLMASQAAQLGAMLPAAAETVMQWLGAEHPEIIQRLQNLNPEQTAQNAAQAVGLDGAKSAATLAFNLLGAGVNALASLAFALVVAPLAMFYFVRDRHIIGGELAAALPPRLREETLSVARDLNNVLGEFLHGQLAVMAVMALFYSAALSLVGLNFALTIGFLAGALVFIPYVGALVGFSLATLVAVQQFDAWSGIIAAWMVMILGGTLEGFFITPKLVGQRVGLHPLATLLALAALGQIFGFIGVLAAIPLAAIVLVLGRHLRRRYINSRFYSS